MDICHVPQTNLNISIWSDQKKFWLVITDDGTWIWHREISKDESNTLRARGMELNVDPDMTDPD